MPPAGTFPPSPGDQEPVFARAAHLRSILETIPDAMIVIDERGRILSFSAAAEEMLGCREFEVLGENVSALMPSPDRERDDFYLARYLRTGERKIIGIGRLEHGIEMQVRLEPSVDQVLIDRIQVQQVILNLVRNAIEAMAKSGAAPSNHLKRKLRRASRSDDRGQWPGPSFGSCRKPFSAIRQHQVRGDGPGLSICHTIIHGHSGHIWADTSILGGTAFHFTLIDLSEANDG